MTNMLRATADGLFCPAGPFHIDPAGPVDLAILTHAHADHARPGSSRYVCAVPGLPVLRRRLGPDVAIDGWTYGERQRIGDVDVSLHPAGHVAGSAQVRVHDGRETWVVSGDYKRQPDPTCTPFEIVPCDTFVSEATFALPIYRWPPVEDVTADLRTWISGNREAGRPTVLYAYSLGKAQRVLALLCDSGRARRAGPTFSLDEPALVHGAVAGMVDAYRDAGTPLPDVEAVLDETRGAATRGRVIIAPPSAINTPWLKRFPDAATAMLSGWMRVRGARRWKGVDRGFVLSDHADWPALLDTIEATGARRVLATHGYADVLARACAERGLDAGVIDACVHGEEA
ncbi:putative exonuclease, DNA ligase-associated [Luteitalea pratensis]|uniref:Putative exonuclease, DNA ligase-associated n=1 Tax=Luteitalea pratensis TaxID=1855912 RepID=A0A143PFC6_LUTPR|nr:ligase-associated DNA damage response exonuclease [Luteitalea pratensis]AMY07237.1 putative exonuclease, DNA ligase-associated [Luteitalea pratensis]